MLRISQINAALSMEESFKRAARVTNVALRIYNRVQRFGTRTQEREINFVKCHSVTGISTSSLLRRMISFLTSKSPPEIPAYSTLERRHSHGQYLLYCNYFLRTQQNKKYSDSLQAGRFKVKTSVGEKDFSFSIHVQTNPGAHPASCTICKGALCRG